MFVEEESKESIFKTKIFRILFKNFIDLPNVENREFGFGVLKENC